MNYGQGAKKLGDNLLLARHLAEANAGLVTVWYGGWDSHGTNPANGHGTIEQEMHKLVPEFDHAVSVFLEDLYDRGLGDKVLLATLFQFLDIPLDLQYDNPSGRPTRMLETGQPITGL